VSPPVVPPPVVSPPVVPPPVVSPPVVPPPVVSPPVVRPPYGPPIVSPPVVSPPVVPPPVVSPPPIPRAVTRNNQKRQSPGTVGTGVTNDQLLSAYTSWFQAGLNSGISGMMQYQFSEQNLTPAPGTVVQSTNGQGTVGATPNDGYGILGTGQTGTQQVLQSASQNVT
jgi:hypothetical protein